MAQSFTWQGIPASTAVVVPFKDDFGALTRCLASLLSSLPAGTRVVAIDDGSHGDPAADPTLAPLLSHRAVVVLRHLINRGPSAARNSGFAWCCENGIDTVILLDSDCVAPPDFVALHLTHHHAHPAAIGVGCAIEGAGVGFWAYFDRMMSWFTSVPRADCVIASPYHAPTTNLSFKLRPDSRHLLHFPERLRTGEDVALFQRLARASETVRFSTLPAIVHFDRTTFAAVLRHQYRWGLHTFFVRSARLDAPLIARAAFALVFIPLAPAYAALTTWLTMRLWLPRHRRDWPFLPLVYVTYLVKAVAVVHGALVPAAALYPDEGRTGMHRAACDYDPSSDRSAPIV
jgi:glycosyltransferase involved in cell wall biosynthesis